MNDKNERTDKRDLDDIKSNLRTWSEFFAEDAKTLREMAKAQGNPHQTYDNAADILDKLSSDLESFSVPESSISELRTAAARMGVAAADLYRQAQETSDAGLVREIWRICDRLVWCKETVERRLYRL